MAGLRGFFAVVNICERVPKVGRWPSGGVPDSSTSVPAGARKSSAGADPPAPLRCAYSIAQHSYDQQGSVLSVRISVLPTNIVPYELPT